MTCDKPKQLAGVRLYAHAVPEVLHCRTVYCILCLCIHNLSFSAGGAAARAELGLTDNYYDTSAGQRERMLKTTEKLDKTTDRIQQGRAQLAETEVCSALPGTAS